MKKIIVLILVITAILAAAGIASAATVLGTDETCKYINDDPENEIICHNHNTIANGDHMYFLINVDTDKNFNITGTITDSRDSIDITAIYDPIGQPGNCKGSIKNVCTIKNPVHGIWLLELTGTSIDIESRGEFDIIAGFDIYKAQKYDIKTSILQDHIKFYKTYIATGARKEHLATSVNWTDRIANIELTIITPDAKTKSDLSKGDDRSSHAYYLNPGSIAEGSWITQLRASDARADLNFYSNYKFEYIENQENINGIVHETETKEYPIIIKDSTIPLALTAIRLEAGDIIKIYSIYDPAGNKKTCQTYTDGCAIKDPEPGIWLVNIQGQTVTGQAPFRIASTHPTYVPEDYKATDNITNKQSVFYYTDIFTENKTHLVAVSSWSDFEPKMEITIISTNLKSVYDRSEADEKVTQKAFLTPGTTAEGRWIVQVKSIWKDAQVTTKSNYNLTRVPAQSAISGDLKMGEKKTYYINVKESTTPLMLSLSAFQAGDDFKVTKVTNPNNKVTPCAQIPSGKESYTCAVKDPPLGTWTVEVSGTNIIGEGPFSLSSTFEITSCGNGVCDASENCGTCPKDCQCKGTSCHRNACTQSPKTVGEKRSWLKDDLDDNIIKQEEYDAKMNELSAYSDDKPISEILKINKTANKEDDSNNPLEALTSIASNPLLIIALIALIPIAILIYKKKKSKY